ncbi:sensor histidine kinase [Neorhizobium sp. DT-125]|uniref:sensor histidine kinase n=1 Tax=Neorhizobium sp. DT-125 TaxID=3396163 RepID=UPI003F1B2F48
MAEAADTAGGRPARSVRYRLLAIALLPMLVILPLLLAVTIYRWDTKFNAALISKVNGDLTIAHQYLARILENTGEHIAALGASARFRDVATEGQPALDRLLGENRERLDLDFLYIATPDGRLVASSTPDTAARLRNDWPILAAAIAGRSTTAIDIFAPEELRRLSPALAERARLPLVETTNAVPTDRTEENRGMVVQSASPVTLADGRTAILVGGMLLNQNLLFIDTINDLVYRQASLPEGSQGTATLFLEDVRISTNVRLFEDRRALGTRVSAAVRSAVLDHGRTWLDSAFVVNDWYISAYEPITDSFGGRVGMLYVGFLQAPFTAAKYQTVVTIALAFLATAAGSVPIFFHWARGIFQPLERVNLTIARVESGDLGARTGPVGSQDEIGRVAIHLDHLLDQLEQRDQALRQWNEELNARVDERTRELQLANRQLEATTKQLIMSEKLAAIGEITAGVAHEINNPIAVMQGNLEVIQSLVGDRAALAKTEFRLLDEQIHRISQIVTKLLQFARPEEFAGAVERHVPGAVIADCLPLVQHLLAKAAIEVKLEDRATRPVLMNRTELQQVIVNLIVNAIHAMPDGGTLCLQTRNQDRGARHGVQIVVQDTGIGMSEEVAAKVFDPFFTTKRQEGTGLGLPISQTLVTRQGGTIFLDSSPGKGAAFTIWLPEAA